MRISQKIENQLKSIPEGSVFNYQEFSIEANEYPAASKKIERLIAKGVLKRASKGIFYKPKQTVFGILQPREDEFLRQYLFKNGQRIAYITGISLYNRMGLTTQISSIIEIASTSRRAITSISNLKIKPTRSYVRITNENYELLEILDAIKDFKKIPDMDKKSVIKILTVKLNGIDTKRINNIIDYSLFYPPRVRALLGAILDNSIFSSKKELQILKNNLNPLTKYEYRIKENILPNAQKWNII
jgi:hypothetical protein